MELTGFFPTVWAPEKRLQQPAHQILFLGSGQEVRKTWVQILTLPLSSFVLFQTLNLGVLVVKEKDTACPRK